MHENYIFDIFNHLHLCMVQKEQNPFKKLRGIRIIYPVIIGLGVVIFKFYKDFNPEAFDSIKFDTGLTWFILLAVVFMVMRDIGYMIRIRILTHKDLSWSSAFRVIMLWEFSSAVLPSAVGGTTVAMLYIHKEGINLGRSTAVVLATSFLDELYFVLMFPILLAVIKVHKLFAVTGHTIGNEASALVHAFLWFAVIGYSLKFIYTIIISYGIFINPRGLKWLLLLIFKLPILRRWRVGANTTGSEIIESSIELKKQGFLFWLKAFGATFFSWTSRYLVVNALFLAFFPVFDHFLIFARQLVMSNMMLIFPTPGGSGFSEDIFTRYLVDFVPGDRLMAISIILIIAFLWRIVSYYPYLIIGALILPSWIKKRFR